MKATVINDQRLLEDKNGAVASGTLRAALALPNGARFYRCALQVNPFEYLRRKGEASKFRSEAEYNEAIIRKCIDLGIEVIAVTDHYRVKESQTLVRAAREAGIFAFGGFEAKTKEGVHFLCLFDPNKDEALERFIGECGVHDSTTTSPTGNKDCEGLLECSKSWGGICIAAHALHDDGGILKVLKGQARMRAWTLPDFLACAISGPVDQSGKLSAIMLNQDAQHRRERPIAVINANDVSDPVALGDPSATCLIKMSEISVEALRQAFLDPTSRIRLNTDVEPDPHAEFVALGWEGGFLDEVRLHFNADLNVLVGGRGTGKSTIVESIRHVLGLEPIGDDARKAHESIVKQVLKPGTKLSLLVQSHHPVERRYVVERTIPNPPVVKNQHGELLVLAPRDIVPGIEVYGQHEISELTKSSEKLTMLLERFVKRETSSASTKSKVAMELERSRTRILEARRELQLVSERLAALPSLEETLTRYKEAGLEELLKEKSLLVREERILKTASERFEPLRLLERELSSALPLDTAFVSTKATAELPNADLLQLIEGIFANLTANSRLATGQLTESLNKAEAALNEVKEQWNVRRRAIDTNYEKLLRELQKSKIDGEEFIRLQRNIEDLRPLKERETILSRDLEIYEAQRRKLLDEWENAKASEYRALERAAKRVSSALQGRVQVTVTMAGSIGPLERLLQTEVGGNLKATLDRLRASRPPVTELAAACREGAEALVKRYGLTQVTAERWSQVGPDLPMKIEELDLPSTTTISLNTAPEGATPTWQTLDDLSTGQKATAVLLLLLLESEAPLIVDQPEDDLDNRFISDGIVPTMRREKTRRQFVFSTHNANIPVLGDAELIVGLTTRALDGAVHGYAEPAQMGSIDAAPVREFVEEILEGGKVAFEMRRLKYGF